MKELCKTQCEQNTKVSICQQGVNVPYCYVLSTVCVTVLFCIKCYELQEQDSLHMTAKIFYHSIHVLQREVMCSMLITVQLTR